MITARAVTLGDQARAVAARHRIAEPHVCFARAHSTSSYETPEFLVVIGMTAAGQRLEMRCPHDRPEYVTRLRLL